MNDLDVTAEKAKRLNEIEDLSLKTIKKVLEGSLEADSEVVKVAVKMMGVVGKNRQTLTHRTAIEFGMATMIATEEGLKKYVAATSPQVIKAVSGKKIVE